MYNGRTLSRAGPDVDATGNGKEYRELAFASVYGRAGERKIERKRNKKKKEMKE